MRKFNDKKSKAVIFTLAFLTVGFFSAEGVALSDFSVWNEVDYNDRGNSEISEENGVLKITSSEDNHAYVWENVSVEKDKIYKFSAKIRTENVSGKDNGALLGIYFTTNYSNQVTGTSDGFLPVEMYFKTNAEEIPLMLSLGGYSRMNSGTAYFKDVELTEAELIPEGANYYEYEIEKKNFDSRWYLLCFLLAAAIAAAFAITCKKT